MFYRNNNVRRKGTKACQSNFFMFHEAAISKDKPGFHDRRMDRREKITFMK